MLGGPKGKKNALNEFVRLNEGVMLGRLVPCAADWFSTIASKAFQTGLKFILPDIDFSPASGHLCSSLSLVRSLA